MAEIFSADAQGMRTQGAADHSRVQPIRDKAKSPQEWLTDFHNMFGYAAHEYLTAAEQFMTRREQELNHIADGHQKTGDTMYAGADQFENMDRDGGDRVRRSDHDNQ